MASGFGRYVVQSFCVLFGVFDDCGHECSYVTVAGCATVFDVSRFLPEASAAVAVCGVCGVGGCGRCARGTSSQLVPSIMQFPLLQCHKRIGLVV